jgi:predicted metal-binding transcription factor (methanogenesis marker protein 9)
MTIANPQKIIEQAGQWACENHKLHKEIVPVVKKFVEQELKQEDFSRLTNEMARSIMVSIGQAIEIGIYIGKFGNMDEHALEVYEAAFSDR